MSEQEAYPQAIQTAGAEVAMAIRRSANWFYWIAGLSVINMVMMASGSGYSMILGSGISQISQAMAQAFWASGATVQALALYGFTVLFALLFLFFGWRANKFAIWAFIAGMVVYALDGVVFIVAADYIGIAFHGFVLYMLYRGLGILLRLKNAQKSPA
jgi:hypothetical protein